MRWSSRADFAAWARSEAFRRATPPNPRLHLGHPEFASFDVIQALEHLVSRSTLRIFRAEAANQWRDAVAVA